MAVSSILNKYETKITATISCASIANGAGRVSTQIDNTTTRANRALVAVTIKSNAAPTVGFAYKFFLVRSSDNGGVAITDDNLGTSDAGVSTEPVQSKQIGMLTLTASATTDFKGVFEVEGLPPKYSIVFWNASGQTVSTTGSDHVVQVIPINWEAQ